LIDVKTSKQYSGCPSATLAFYFGRADSRADERNLETPAKVSRATGVARTTLLSAMDRKEVEHVKMPLGTVLVDIDSATEWANVQHRPHSVKN